MDENSETDVSGSTSSSDFPVTSGVFQGTNNGGVDVYVVKFDSTGSTLAYSTYLGGAFEGVGTSMASDPVGNVCAPDGPAPEIFRQRPASSKGAIGRTPSMASSRASIREDSPLRRELDRPVGTQESTSHGFFPRLCGL
jgi:hypothetical protein